jgi:uncharacterized membrane protein YphA (DoxX/SURF4 family)
MNIALWIIQVLRALLFLFAGGVKLIMPIEEMTKGMPVAIPGLFLRFIGVCEVLGGLGLVFPMLLRIKPWLTPIAAIGLGIIILGAIAFSLKLGVMQALLPFVVGMLLIFVAYGRWPLIPAQSESR